MINFTNENLVLSTNLDKKIETEASDIMNVIEKNKNLIGSKK